MIQRPSLPNDLRAAMSRLEGKTAQELISEYNEQCRLGFTGVYAQAIHVLALHQQLKARFGKGPLVIENNALLTMEGPIEWNHGDWSQSARHSSWFPL